MYVCTLWPLNSHALTSPHAAGPLAVAAALAAPWCAMVDHGRGALGRRLEALQSGAQPVAVAPFLWGDYTDVYSNVYSIECIEASKSKSKGSI